MASHPFQHFMVRYGASERIFTEGDLGTTMFIVQSGKVQLFRTVDGQKRDHGLMEKGDFFGEMSILEGMPRAMSAEALEDAELIEINSMTFDKMIKGNIEIAIRMLRKFSLRLRDLERRIDQVTRRGAMVKGANEDNAGAVEAASGPRLHAEEGTQVFKLSDGETTIGRFDPVCDHRPDVDLTPLDLKRSVSRRHALIVDRGEEHFLVEEEGALNGTHVNGRQLDNGEEAPLRDGDKIQIGAVQLVFHR